MSPSVGIDTSSSAHGIVVAHVLTRAVLVVRFGIEVACGVVHATAYCHEEGILLAIKIDRLLIWLAPSPKGKIW